MSANNSFKPRPLRGSAQAVVFTTPPCRAAVRLNSGVRCHLKFLLLTVCLVALAGCSANRQPPVAQVRAELGDLAKNCAYKSHAAGEGDSDTVYIHVSYSCSKRSDPLTLTAMYHQTNAGDWRLIYSTFD